MSYYCTKEELDNYLIAVRSPILGIGITPKVNALVANNIITAAEGDAIKERLASKHGNKMTINAKQNTKKEAANLLTASTCEDCGELLNGGTFGYIFQSKKHPNRVIKATRDGFATAFDCPAKFKQEFIMWKRIKSFFPSKIKIITMVEIYNERVEKRRCLLEMDRIRPAVLTEKQIQKCIALRDNLLLYQRPTKKMANVTAKKKAFVKTRNEARAKAMTHDIIDRLSEQKWLFQLLPGDMDPYFLSEGGGETSKWIQIGKNIMAIYFEILGMDIIQYYKDLEILMGAAIKNNIKLTDVEFILGSNDGKTNHIFLIDFDKVAEMNSVEKNNQFDVEKDLLDQPMFLNKTKNKTRYKQIRRSIFTNKNYSPQNPQYDPGKTIIHQPSYRPSRRLRSVVGSRTNHGPKKIMQLSI